MKKFLPFLIVGGVVLLFLRGSRAGASPAGNIGGAMLPAGAAKDSASWLSKLFGGVGGIGGGSMSGISGTIGGVGKALQSVADLFRAKPSSPTGAGPGSLADSWGNDLEAGLWDPSPGYGRATDFWGEPLPSIGAGGIYNPGESVVSAPFQGYDFFSGSPTSLSAPNYSGNYSGGGYVAPTWGSGASLYDFGGYNAAATTGSGYQPGLFGYGSGFDSGGGYGGNYGFSPTPTYSGLFESPTGMGFGGYGGGGDVGGMSFADANAIGG